MFDSLWPHGLQLARLPCPSLTPGVWAKSHPLSQWWTQFCHPLLLLPSIFPSIKVFPVSLLFTSGGQSIGFSSSASVLPMNIQDWFPLGWTGWISLQSVQGTLKSLLQYHSSKASILRPSTFLIVQLSHPYMTIGKTVALTRRTFVGKVMSLLFNMLSRLVIAFLPRSKHILISWLHSPSTVFRAQENKLCHCFHFLCTYLPWSDGNRCHDLRFLNVEF